LTTDDLKRQVNSGVKVGISTPNDIIIARDAGVPIKVVAGHLGEAWGISFYVKGDGSINNVKDLDGKRIGVISLTHTSSRQVLFMNNKFGIKAEPLPLVNTTNMVVALKLGKIDAFWSGDRTVLRLIDSGELRILVNISDFITKPMLTQGLWASDDLIEQNPDLVRRFVKATLETVRYLKENPSYAGELYIRISNAPKDLADKVIRLIDWQPSGRGSGNDLLTAVKNNWQFEKESGTIPGNFSLKIEDVVDVRFLP